MPALATWIFRKAERSLDVFPAEVGRGGAGGRLLEGRVEKGQGPSSTDLAVSLARAAF